MKKCALDDAVDRMVKSNRYVNSRLAFRNGYDRNFRHQENPADHLRAKYGECVCNPDDDTNSSATCICPIKFEQHDDNCFPSGPLDVEGSLCHITTDIAPYIKEKLNNYFEDD
jgi:hypothetical protein